MSQEVSKWLVNGLQPTYKWGILGLQPTYQPFTNLMDIQVWQDFSRFWHLQEALLVDETTWDISLTYRLSYESPHKIKDE